MSSYIMVVNKSAWPIHGALSWANIQQQCFNSLAKGGSSHDFVVNLGWHDLTIVPGSESNKFDKARNNDLGDVGRFILNVVAFLNPALNASLAVSQLAGGKQMIDIGAPPPGAPKVAKVTGKDIRIGPVQVRELYAPHGYTVTITGGQIEGTYDQATETFTITGAQPLKLRWVNRTTKTSGEVTGRVA